MNKLAREAVGVGVTVARYGLAEKMARHVKDEKPITLDMAELITADVLDGEVLRKFDLDTPVRRVADGVVDHLSMARVVCEVAKKYPESRAYIGILAARAVIVGGLNTFHIAKTGEITKGNTNQRATNLATAAFALATVTRNKKLTHITGAIASGIAIATIPVYFKGLGKEHDGEFRQL
jgi:hypothetical protein